MVSLADLVCLEWAVNADGKFVFCGVMGFV